MATTTHANVKPAVHPSSETLVLSRQDMPEGFGLKEQEQVDNRSAAREFSNPDEWFNNYKSWGRIDGWEVEYEKGFQKESINSGVVVYQTVEGARQAFKEERKAFEEELRKNANESNIDLKLRVQGDINIGDESYSVHGSADQIPGRSQGLDFVAIVFVFENVGGFVTWYSFEDRILTDDVVQLARKLREYIRVALQ